MKMQFGDYNMINNNASQNESASVTNLLLTHINF